jgi:hypothetical protein
MLRRTAPAVSFTTSHMALAYKSSRPLLGGDLTSGDLIKAAWDEMPFTNFHTSRKETWAWVWKAKYELGIRDYYRHTKARIITNYVLMFLILACFMEYQYALPIVIWTGKPPWYAQKENAVAYSKRKYGADVWCADGKFVVPWMHINPPMLTMTVAELNA